MGKTYFILTKLLLFFSLNAKAQSDIPMSMLLPNDSLFSKDDLKKNKIKTVRCDEVLYRFNDMIRPDTQAITAYYFDSLYRIEKVRFTGEATFKNEPARTECFYTYKGDSTIINCFTKKTTWNGQVGSYEVQNTSVYKNGIPVYDIQNIYNRNDNQLIQYERDTSVYDKNGNNTMVLTISFDHLKPGIYDTLITQKEFDEQGRVVSLQIIPSMVGKTSMSSPHKRHSIYTFAYDSLYTYSTHFTIGLFSQDTSLIQEEKTAKLTIDDSFILKKSESIKTKSIDYYMKLNDIEHDRVIEYFLSETKIQENRNGSLLPDRITIVEADAIRVFYFKYL